MNLSALKPPAQSKNSGSSTQSGRSSRTAILAALSLIEFIWMIETFIAQRSAPEPQSIWAERPAASTAHEGGEGLELVGDEAARRRVGQLARRRVDLRIDLRNDDLGLIESARVEKDKDVAQVKLRPEAAEQPGR